MIEFLQDYETKAIPPEVFRKGERPERTPESEMYFVQLGVAGYVVDGKLVDADYHPIVVVEAEAANTTTVTGRAGELALGDGTPQRASSGPQVVLTTGGLTDEQREGLERVLTESAGLRTLLVERDDSIGLLNGSLATLQLQVADANATIGGRDQDIARLTDELATANGRAEAANTEVARLTEELAAANGKGDDAAKEVDRLTAQVEDLTQQVADLKAKPARGK
ncbi:hypothetical protein [Sphingomonas adhaesiva]|uniref:hypothetical protein n=1 Tax=Sphingomonas adhaesiva TaxID=28212 RepID=UPI002FF5A022